MFNAIRRFKLVHLILAALVATPGATFADEPYEHTTPFVDPLEFDPDFQFFKPFDPDRYGGPAKQRVGWFFSYDRMHIATTRPETGGSFGLAGQLTAGFQNIDPLLPDPRPIRQDAGVQSTADQHDFTYGNRIDIGFMTEDDHGWLTSYVKVINPNVALNDENLLNGDIVDPNVTAEWPDLNGDYLGVFSSSINASTFNSLELSKIFRLKPLHNGIVIEPLFGIRYMKYRDFFFEKDEQFDIIAVGTTLFSVVEIDTFAGMVDNQMLAGQFGFRAHGQRGRWHLSGELRAFGGNNWQVFERTHRDELQLEDLGTQVIISPFVPDEGNQYKRDEFEVTELVIGTEIRANATYNIWRDVGINIGLQLIHIGRGIARGFDLENNNERVTMIGGTIGIVVNR